MAHKIQNGLVILNHGSRERQGEGHPTLLAQICPGPGKGGKTLGRAHDGALPRDMRWLFCDCDLNA